MKNRIAKKLILLFIFFILLSQNSKGQDYIIITYSGEMDMHLPDLLIKKGKINQKDIMADSLYNEISFHSIELDDAEYNILKSLLYSNKLLKKAYKNRIIYRAFNIKIVKGHQQKIFFVQGSHNNVDFFTLLIKKVKEKNISEDLTENLEKILNSIK